MQDDDTATMLEIERSFWQSIQDKDADAAERLMDYPSIVTGAQGVTSIPDGATYRRMVDSGQWVLKDYTFSNVQVRRLTDDVAIVAYKVEEDLTMKGEPLTLTAFDTSVWVRRDGKWLCAMHTEAPAGDPFGRSR